MDSLLEAKEQVEALVASKGWADISAEMDKRLELLKANLEDTSDTDIANIMLLKGQILELKLILTYPQARIQELEVEIESKK